MRKIPGGVFEFTFGQTEEPSSLQRLKKTSELELAVSFFLFLLKKCDTRKLKSLRLSFQWLWDELFSALILFSAARRQRRTGVSAFLCIMPAAAAASPQTLCDLIKTEEGE